MTKDKSNPVQFGGDVADMMSAVARAKANKVPVGGVPMPQMPRLDQPPPNVAAQKAAVSAQRILTPEERAKLEAEGRFIPGAGSAYAANQPPVQVTDSEGNQQVVDPRLQPRPPGSGLRSETVEQLQAIAAANTSPKKDDEDLEKINKEINDLDDVYEENEFGERVRSLLGNKKRAQIIEARCAPMSFEDLLLTGRVQQKVPIIPGRFEPTFQSLGGDDNLEILRLISQVRGNEQYLLDTLSIYNLTAGLFSLNTKVLPKHQDANGDFNEEMFRSKLKMVTKMALPILADLAVNYRWFTRRVQKLTVVDDIKSF